MTFNIKDWQPPASDPGALHNQLLDALRDLWTRGWMPADVTAATAYHHPARVVRVCERLILEEHDRAGYGDRVTPRWQRQWAALSESGPQEARADDLFDLYLTLSLLPALRPLGPPPGSAHAGTVRSETTSPPHTTTQTGDADTLRRVRALLAKAESTEFEAEAEAFTAKAQALITTHSLQHVIDSLDADEPRGGPDEIRLALERPYDTHKFGLLSVVANANRCRAVRHRGLGLTTVMGFAVDLEAVELLYTSLLVQATAAMQRHGSRRDEWGVSNTAAFRRSFLTGFTGRINERLTSAAETAGREAEAATEGNRLAPVLASRAAEIDRAVDEAFPRLRSLRSNTRLDDAGFAAGVSAADGADLGVRRPLAS